jgi:FixJ family two-component response regulator
MNVRVLLATPNSEELLFLQEVLEDVQTGRHWRGWFGIQPFTAMSLDQTAELLACESMDAVLLDVELLGARPIDAFRRIQAASPHIPAILIAAKEDVEIAVRLVREGAQDFLMAPEMDAAPLAHALGTAIERHRTLSAARAAATEDPLTGLSNGKAFLALAERDRRIAGKLGCRWMVVVAEPNNPGTFSQTERHDLFVMETAERFRRLSGAADLLARSDDVRFGLGIFDAPGETLDTALARIESMAREQDIAIGAAIFDPAHPLSLEALLEEAERNLTPHATAVRT